MPKLTHWMWTFHFHSWDIFFTTQLHFSFMCEILWNSEGKEHILWEFTRKFNNFCQILFPFRNPFQKQTGFYKEFVFLYIDIANQQLVSIRFLFLIYKYLQREVQNLNILLFLFSAYRYFESQVEHSIDGSSVSS